MRDQLSFALPTATPPNAFLGHCTILALPAFDEPGDPTPLTFESHSLCLVGNIANQHHDDRNPLGVCRRCGSKIPRLSAKPSASQPAL